MRNVPALLDAQYQVVEYVRAEPECGVDFCDHCGDCLHCYGGDPCPDGTHSWIVYEDEVDEWKANHEWTLV